MSGCNKELKVNELKRTREVQRGALKQKCLQMRQLCQEGIPEKAADQTKEAWVIYNNQGEVAGRGCCYGQHGELS